MGRPSAGCRHRWIPREEEKRRREKKRKEKKRREEREEKRQEKKQGDSDFNHTDGLMVWWPQKLSFTQRCTSFRCGGPTDPTAGRRWHQLLHCWWPFAVQASSTSPATGGRRAVGPVGKTRNPIWDQERKKSNHSYSMRRELNKRIHRYVNSYIHLKQPLQQKKGNDIFIITHMCYYIEILHIFQQQKIYFSFF